MRPLSQDALRVHRRPPTHYDTDHGGTHDGREVDGGSDPSNYASYPSNPKASARRRG